MGLDIMHYMTMIKGNYFLGKVFGAWNLFEEMKERGSSLTLLFIMHILAGFSRNGLRSEEHDPSDYMDAQGLKPNSVTHNIIIEGLCKCESGRS